VREICGMEIPVMLNNSTIPIEIGAATLQGRGVVDPGMFCPNTDCMFVI